MVHTDLKSGFLRWLGLNNLLTNMPSLSTEVKIEFGMIYLHFLENMSEAGKISEEERSVFHCKECLCEYSTTPARSSKTVRRQTIC